MEFLNVSDIELSAEQIAKLCDVSTRTARRWLARHTRAPKAAIKLIDLHQRGRVMPAKWPHGWQFTGHGYLDIGHSKALAWQQIDWYFYSVSCWYSLLELLPRIEARLDSLSKTATPAQVIDLNKYRAELQALKSRPFSLPADLREYYTLGEVETHRKTGC